MPIADSVQEPPAIYASGPVRGGVMEIVLPKRAVAETCDALSLAHNVAPLPPGKYWLGCSIRFNAGGGCYVVRVDDQRIREHELAHCRGWPGDHPGGVWK